MQGVYILQKKLYKNLDDVIDDLELLEKSNLITINQNIKKLDKLSLFMLGYAFALGKKFNLNPLLQKLFFNNQ